MPSVKSHNIRDMTKEIEQAEARVKASMSRTATLPTSSTSSTTGGSTFGSMPDIASKPKWRRGLNIVDQEFNMGAREKLDAMIARMFYTDGLSFNLSKNPYYTKSFTYAVSN